MTKREVQHFLCLISLTVLFISCGTQGTDTTQSTVHEHISIEGSTALQPFISQIANTFEKQTLQVTAKVKGGGSNIEFVVRYPGARRGKSHRTQCYNAAESRYRHDRCLC